MQKSIDRMDTTEEAIDFTLQTATAAAAVIEDESLRNVVSSPPPPVDEEVVSVVEVEDKGDQMYVAENGMLMLPKDHPEYFTLIKLQLENQELLNWKQQLQAKINAERAECVRLKKIAMPESVPSVPPVLPSDDPEYERLVDHYAKENALLEQKRVLLAKEIFDENVSLIQLQVELAMKQLIH